MVLAILDDLIFRAKLESSAQQLGTQVTVAADPSGAQRPGQGWSRVLIDLNLTRGDALATIRALRQTDPDVPIIGYCSHVQKDLQQQALSAGCTTVLPRSKFVQQLSELLSS